MKASLKGLNVANDKNLRISQSKVRSVSDLGGQSFPNNSAYLVARQQETKEQVRQRLIEQNKRLKNQALELAQQMDDILSQEKFKKKYGVGLNAQSDRETQLKKLQARRQQQKIQQLKVQIAAIKRENEYVHDQSAVVQKQNAVRVLQSQLKQLQTQRNAYLNVRKQQAKALNMLSGGEKYVQKIEKTRAQIAKIKEECKILTAKTLQNEKLIMKNHEKSVTKNKRIKQIQQKIKQSKQKMRKGNTNVVTIEMISQIESQIMKLQAQHKDAQRVWIQKLNNLEAECANRRLQQQKKLIILRDKEKEVRLNDIRLKQFKKLIMQNKSQKKDIQQHPKEFRSKRNIKYFQRELS